MKKEIIQEMIDSILEDFEVMKMTLQQGYVASSIFHLQQVVEKSLKLFLYIKQQNYPFTHDISVLLNLCKKYDIFFEDYDELILLDEYYTSSRYPPYKKPSVEDVEFLAEKTKTLLDFILKEVRKRKK